MPINVYEFVCSELNRIRRGKGLEDISLNSDALILSENVGIDSLDLAILVISLEEATGKLPFKNGFVMFETIGELISLFTN